MTETEKITVAHVIGSLNYGGAENQVVQILNGINDKLFNKYLITFKYVDTAISRGLNCEVSVRNIPLKRWGQIGCISKLHKFFKQYKINVVQTHMFHANLYGAVAAKFAEVPVVITTEHGKNLWKSPIYHFIERRLINPLVDMRVAVSKDIKKIRITSGDVTRDKILTVPNCVDIPQHYIEKEKNDRIQIGTVGRLVSAKDYGTLLTALQYLTKEGLKVQLTFVGDGPERKKLALKAKDLGVEKNVVFTGFRGDVESFLQKFDIFVLSSIREGIPVAMLEAMAKRIPVVATRVGGIPEVIEEGKDGLLVDSRNPGQIADGIRKLINDQSLRKKIGEAGFKKVKRINLAAGLSAGDMKNSIWIY